MFILSSVITGDVNVEIIVEYIVETTQMIGPSMPTCVYGPSHSEASSESKRACLKDEEPVLVSTASAFESGLVVVATLA